MRLRVADAALAIPAVDVDQICELGAVVPLPRAPRHVIGLVRVRERAVPVVALDALANIGRPDAQRVVILSRDGMRVGVACDEVMGVCDLATQGASPLEKTRDLPRFFTHEHHDPQGPVLLFDTTLFLQDARIRKR